MSDPTRDPRPARSLGVEPADKRWQRARLPSPAGRKGPGSALSDERARRFRLERDLERTRAELAAVRDQLDLIENSRFWRYSRPVRGAWTLLRPGRDPSGATSIQRLRIHAHSARSIWRHQGTAALVRKILWVLRNGPPSAARQRYAPAPVPPPAPTRRVVFEEFPDPQVSIIVPVLDNYAFTHACLEAVRQTALGTSYEVIVVDDGSSDENSEIERRIDGLRVVRHERNLGFTPSCNDGARAARGRYLVFLNNDTVVQPGWLTALVRTFETQPKAGLVGAKLIYPDGRLQEAGGIIWRDGTALNYGRLEERSVPEYNYLREVDYCSGACIAIPRALFEKIGGFDRRFVPAYYEDTDLAFAVRKAGHRVLYQPECEVVHFEGATSGTDMGAGIKRYQEVNRASFIAKWRSTLEVQPERGTDPTLASCRPPSRRILVIDARTPVPTRDAGSLRMLRILEILRERGVHVSFLPENLAEVPVHTASLQRIGVRALHAPFVTSMSNHLRRHGREYDAVILSRRDVMARYVWEVRKYCPGVPVVFDTVDLHFLRESREAHLHGTKNDRRAASSRMQLELALATEADMTWVVSEEEQQTLAQHAPGASVEVVSVIHEVTPTRLPFQSRAGIVFIGNFEHPPNRDAVSYFIREVHPRVRSRIGDVPVTVIGGNVPRELLDLASDQVGFTGGVEDIRPYFERCRLSVAPLRFGAGVKGKINTSMSLGVPVVGTSIAVEGMRLEHERDVLVADDPESFAACVVRLHRDESLWNRVSENGMRNVRAHFSKEVAARTLEGVLDLPRAASGNVAP